VEDHSARLGDERIPHQSRTRRTVMRGRRSLSLVTFTLAVLLAPLVVLGQSTFTPVDYPGATRTIAQGINAKGDVVGWYIDTAGKFHGFVRDKGGFAPIDFPEATRTDAWAINPAGEITGSYNDSTGIQHGYLLRRGRFTPFDVPGSTFTAGFGISPEGDVVGHFGISPSGKMNGFLLRNGAFTTYSHPLPNAMTCGYGVSPERGIVGHFQDGAGIHGFLLNDDGFTAIDIPKGMSTYASGINPQGEIVGYYTEIATNRAHGFVLEPGNVVTQIDVPGALNTWVRRNNPRGDLVGSYQETAGGKIRGFLMTAK
jgi:uncharacterized membrane protein